MPLYEKIIYWSYAGVIALIQHYNLDSEWFIILTVLMWFDTLFWVTKAYVLYSKDNPGRLSSRRLKIWVISKISILMLVALFWMILWYVTDINDISTMSITTILWILIVAEFISILQNVMMIRSGEEMKEWDAISFVLNSIYGTFTKALERAVQQKIDLPVE